MATIQLPDVPSFQTMLTAAQAGDSKSRLAGAINTAINEFSPEKLKERYELSKYIKDLKSAYITPDEARARLKLQLKLLTDASGNPLFKSEEEINKQVNELISKLGSESNIMNDRNEFIRNKKNTIDQNRKELYNKLAYEAKLKKLKSQQSNSERIGGMLYRSLGYKADVSGIELPGQVINSIDESVDAEYPTISDQDLQQMAEKEYPAERSIAVKDLDKYIEDIKSKGPSLGQQLADALRPIPQTAKPTPVDISKINGFDDVVRLYTDLGMWYKPEFIPALIPNDILLKTPWVSKYVPGINSGVEFLTNWRNEITNDPQWPAFKQNVSTIINKKIVEVTGAAMGEAEAGRIAGELPEPGGGPRRWALGLINNLNTAKRTVNGYKTVYGSQLTQGLLDKISNTIALCDESIKNLNEKMPAEADKQTKSESPKKQIKRSPEEKGAALLKMIEDRQKQQEGK